MVHVVDATGQRTQLTDDLKRIPVSTNSHIFFVYSLPNINIFLYFCRLNSLLVQQPNTSKGLSEPKTILHKN
jgi:hypothetical protein